MDGGAWRARVHEVTKSRTRLSNFGKGQLKLRESPSLLSGGNGLLKLVIL